MKVQVPSKFFSDGIINIFPDLDATARQKLASGVPGSTSPVEVPSLFTEIPANNGNDVCHVKVKNPGIVISGTSTPVMADGGSYWLINRGYSRDYHSYLRTIVADHRSCKINVSIDMTNPSYSEWKVRVVFYFRVDSDPLYYGREAIRDTIVDVQRTVYQDQRRRPVDSKSLMGDAITETDVNWWLAQFVADFQPYFQWGTPPVGEFSAIADAFERYISQTQVVLPSSKVRGTAYDVVLTSPPKPLESYLILDERNLLINGMSLKPYAAYHMKALRQAAYLDALDHVPQLNENSLANVLELVGFIKSLVIDHRVEIPESLSSAWLAYRYTVGTTRMDAEEAIQFVHRHVDDDFLRKGFSCYGASSQEIEGVSVVMKCRLDVRQKELSYLDKIWTSLYRYGLTPSFYVVWDMIPYSFIVDWFLPVGDILSGYDKTRMYDRTYDISNIWFSLQYDIVDGPCVIHAYTRYHSDGLPEYQGYYVLENKGTTSNRVIGFRVLDALSLIFR